jgi:ATP-dependent RNA helicase DDX46/PRP5
VCHAHADLLSTAAAAATLLCFQQITRIVSNIRPDRQTVMFSATFPRAVETLARQILNNPVEIQVRVYL